MKSYLVPYVGTFQLFNLGATDGSRGKIKALPGTEK
jgi:hypothetical protein